MPSPSHAKNFLQDRLPDRENQPPQSNNSTPRPVSGDGIFGPLQAGLVSLTVAQHAAAESLSQCAPTTLLIGHSAGMRQLNSIIERIASLDSSVLITGATGTGKELVARAIHQCSLRVRGKFVDINCSAIPDTLFEAEVFGHERGSFTGAHATRRGLFEDASGGTLFLDEVDALSLPAQAKLLRVLQERNLRRVGGRENIPIDVRIIAATNRDLHEAMAEGTFRPDLFFRLRVVPIQMPELSAHIEDILLLIEHFMRRHEQQHAREDAARPRRFSDAALCALTSYSWPGNVRELENTVEFALAIGHSDELGVEDLPPEIGQQKISVGHILDQCLSADASLEEVQKQYILKMFERHGRLRNRTADALGIDRRTLYRKLKEYGVADNTGDTGENKTY